MILSDFDRTLSDERDNFFLREDVRELVNLFSKRFLFFVVTGRERKFIDILAKGLSPSGWILENGGIILFQENIIKLAGNSWYSERDKIVKILEKMNIPYSLGEVIIYVNDALKFKGILDESIHCAKVEWNRNDAMIMPKTVSKGNAVIYLKQYLRFEGKMIAIGDSENDIPLFKVADIKIAVANALPQIKNIADYVLEKEDGNGVKDFLSKILDDENFLDNLLRRRFSK